MVTSTPREVFVIEVLNFITGLLSVIACIWLFSICSKTPKPWPVSLKLILVLTTADFIYSICNFIAAFDAKMPNLCMAEAIIREWSLIGSLYWAAAIAILTFKSFDKGSLFNQRSFYNKALISGIAVSTFFSLYPLFTDKYSYGSRLFGCWVVTEEEYRYNKNQQLGLVMLFMGVPAILSLIISLRMYWKVAKKFNEFASMFKVPDDIGVKQLFMYPAVIFLSCIPALLDNIVQIYWDFSLESFNIIHVILFHSLGFSNALVYGWQRRKYARASVHDFGIDSSNNESSYVTNDDFSTSQIQVDVEKRHRNSADIQLFKSSLI